MWSKDEVIVQSPQTNITVDNLEEFYAGFSYPSGKEMLKDVQDLTKDLKHPGVDVYCMHGTGVPTTER